MPQMNVRPDRSLAFDAGGSTHFVVVDIKARRQEAQSERLGLDLGLSLDRSGSMGGPKMALACEGVATSVRLLRESDRFAIVTFNTRVDTPFPIEFATDANKREALASLRYIEPSGGTDLFMGYLKASLQASQDMREDRLARVLLLTDGQANHGTVDEDEIVGHVEQLRLRGLSTSTIGIGADFNESLLTRMASAGGGNSYFVAHAEELPTVLSGEVGDSLTVTERDVVLEVRVPKGVRVEAMDTSRLTVVPGGLQVKLGDLVSEQSVRVVFEVQVPEKRQKAGTELEFVLHRAGEEAPPIRETLTLTYAGAVEYRQQPIDADVRQAAYANLSARARRTAVELNSRHEYAEARRVMRDAHDRLREFAQGDEAAFDYLVALDRDVEVHAHRMDPMESKRRRYDAEFTLRDRDQDGRPRRGR